jgi:protein TonB
VRRPGARVAGLALVVFGAVVTLGVALLSRRDEGPRELLGGVPLRAVAVDAENTPPALLSLLEPSAADPLLDRGRLTLPDPAPVRPAPVDTTPMFDRSPAPPPPPSPDAANGAADMAPLAPDTTVAPPAAAPLAPLEPPVVLRAAWFAYPEEARRRRSEGDVEVRILVDTSGGVQAVELEEGAIDTTLNAAALDAARTMRFRPARRGDVPVAVWFNYRFSFALPS